MDSLSGVVVIDSSVWIDYFKGTNNLQTDLLASLLASSIVAITDVILMEVLRGFRSDTDYAQVMLLMDHLTCFDILNKQKALRYADYYRQLRKRGITIRKSNDVMIAGFCIDHELPLLFSDRDFLPFVEHFGLVSAL